MLSCGVAEGGVDVAGSEDPPRGAGNTEPGVVVDQVEDLDLGVVGEAVVGDVELPALVRGVRAKALIAAFRAFVRLRGDESAGGQDPPDRRHRGHGEGIGVGVVALVGQDRCGAA